MDHNDKSIYKYDHMAFISSKDCYIMGLKFHMKLVVEEMFFRMGNRLVDCKGLGSYHNYLHDNAYRMYVFYNSTISNR